MAQAWWILSKKQGSGKSFRQIPEGISWLIMSMVTFVYLREGCRGGELDRISLTHFSSCYHDSECAVTINLLSWTTFSHSPTPHWNNFLPSTHQQSLFHSSSWHFMSSGSWTFFFHLHSSFKYMLSGYGILWVRFNLVQTSGWFCCFIVNTSFVTKHSN